MSELQEQQNSESQPESQPELQQSTSVDVPNTNQINDLSQLNKDQLTQSQLNTIKREFLNAIEVDDVNTISRYFHFRLIKTSKLAIYTIIQNLPNIFDFCLRQDSSIANVIVNETNGFRLFEYACQYNRLEMVSKLVEQYSVNPDFINNYAKSQFTYLSINICIYESHIQLIKYILNVCPSIQYIAHKLTKNLPIHLAVLCENSEIVLILSEKIENIDRTNKRGNTALHLASYRNDLESVKILITYGANVNAKNLEYNTPLDIAIIEENQSINDFLIGLNAQASYGSSYQLYLSSQ